MSDNQNPVARNHSRLHPSSPVDTRHLTFIADTHQTLIIAAETKSILQYFDRPVFPVVAPNVMKIPA